MNYGIVVVFSGIIFAVGVSATMHVPRTVVSATAREGEGGTGYGCRFATASLRLENLDRFFILPQHASCVLQ